jgi:hypothetical protein
MQQKSGSGTIARLARRQVFPATVNRTISQGMTLDLTDDEAAALAKHLRHAIDYDRYPLAPRLDPLKAILAKLEPPPPQPELPPPLPSGLTTRVGRGRRRG